MTPVELTWGPVICTECETCICSTLVQYRKSTESSFTTPSTGNPTQQTKFLINIEEGVLYEVQLTFFGPYCKKKSVKIPLMLPSNGCCPPGYSLTPDNSQCFKQESVAAIPPSGTLGTLVAKSGGPYSTCGSYIYNPGFNLDGTGVSTKIPIINDIGTSAPSTLWVNGVGNCVDSTLTQGPLNRTGVWSNTVTNTQMIGFGICRTITESKQYYIGIGTDNFGIIQLNGVTILQQNEGSLNAQYSTGGATFKVWHIYPVTLNAGPNVINIIGQNTSGIAAIGCELYNATADQLRACTNVNQLAPYVLFSSQTLAGQPVQIGSAGVGYTCPTGYNSCEDPTVCTRVLTTAKVNC